LSVPELTDAELDGLVAYWEAANYLTVAQIYLRDNALLREPLRPEHIKPRLLGHWAPPLASTSSTPSSTG
jgi:xylulose-5-phosphate/fructose-6-phosphate phosphoketolase